MDVFLVECVPHHPSEDCYPTTENRDKLVYSCRNGSIVTCDNSRYKGIEIKVQNITPELIVENPAIMQARVNHSPEQIKVSR